jgi:hypothetical protein
MVMFPDAWKGPAGIGHSSEISYLNQTLFSYRGNTGTDQKNWYTSPHPEPTHLLELQINP